MVSLREARRLIIRTMLTDTSSEILSSVQITVDLTKNAEVLTRIRRTCS